MAVAARADAAAPPLAVASLPGYAREGGALRRALFAQNLPCIACSHALGPCNGMLT